MKKQPKTEDLTYSTAQFELEQILADLQNEQTGIDELAEKVARAADLIAFCKTKLRATEEEISRILN
jgi:exodeoxyribonuclease VII small subunit